MEHNPTSRTEPILTASNISKSFGNDLILKSVDISIKPGEIKVLIGPSGGGKSTILQCLNCLETPDSGEIRFNGERIDFHNRKALYRYRQQVGMIFQDFNLFDHMTALKNITIALQKVKGMTGREASDRAFSELEQVGLQDKSHLYPAELSGGQKQRVAIARALAMKPKLLLLDEPTSALDPELVGEVTSVIRKLADKGITMLMATHQISFMRSLADRILFIRNGEVEEQGKPEELLGTGMQTRCQKFCYELNHMDGEKL
ncbi:MAG: amino acid ABC transporter ATP-binding protein [Desulfobacteraceae bacterium]